MEMLKMKKEVFAAEYLMQNAEKGLELHEDLMAVGLVNIEHEVAIMTLFSSCTRRINDTKYKHKKWYANKACDFNSSEDFVWEIITKKTDFWLDWLKQVEKYKISGWDYNQRPTIDRIDSSKGYSLNNIQVLPFIKNAQRISNL